MTWTDIVYAMGKPTGMVFRDEEDEPIEVAIKNVWVDPAPEYDVSVLIASYGTPVEKLQRAVASCLNQRGVRVEVVLVYDGETPLFAPDHENVVVIYQEKLGVAAAWNRALQECAGRYVMLLGDDDFLQVDCLLPLVEALDNRTVGRSAYAYGDVQLQWGVHVTPEWKKHEKGEWLTTSYAVLYPRWHRHKCSYYHPDDLPVYVTDYDFILQLEADGVIGVKVPGVVLHNIEPPRMGVQVEAIKNQIGAHLWGRFFE